MNFSYYIFSIFVVFGFFYYFFFFLDVSFLDRLILIFFKKQFIIDETNRIIPDYFFLIISMILVFFLIRNSFISLLISVFFIPIYIVLGFISLLVWGYYDLFQADTILFLFSSFLVGFILYRINNYKHINNNKIDFSLSQKGFTKEEVSIVFIDIKNFTNISESIGSPTMVGFFLDAFFSFIERAIVSHNGILDKIMGDGALLIFRGNNKENNAVSCALYLLGNMEGFINFIANRIKGNSSGGKYFEKILNLLMKEEFDIRVGISTGEVLIGNIGGASINDITIIGDSVNLASRLEGLNRTYKTRVLCDLPTYKNLSRNFFSRIIDKIKVKGKDDATYIFQPVVSKADNIDILKIDQEYLNKWNESIKYYLDKDFEGAYNILSQYIYFKDSDPTFEVIFDRIKGIISGEIYLYPGWDGAWEFKDK